MHSRNAAKNSSSSQMYNTCMIIHCNNILYIGIRTLVENEIQVQRKRSKTLSGSPFRLNQK